ncbi:hypothetical protein HBI47_198460 [Parastagonospora nodorum]|nr:hypothetical protein HBI47_198460 [Parastagonospora nodorum]
MGSSPGPPDQEPKVGTKHGIWIHMYPARRVNGPVGIQFHAYDSEDKHVGWHDENNIGKVVTGCASAFAFPAKASLGRWTKDKLVALAKWYFLRTLVEYTTESDKKKLQFGMPITPSFKDDLKAVCREFEEQATRSQTSVTPVATTVGKVDSQESDISDLSSVSVKEDDSEPAHSIAVEVNRLMSNEAGPRPTPDANPASTEHVAETLIELQKREKDVVDDITKTEEEIERLQQILRERKSNKQQLERQKMDLFKGLSVEAAFDLGQQVERHSAKRQRLD